MESLDFLFYPKSVAVIGASHVPGKVGNAIMRSITLRFNGKVYAVNVKGGEIEVNGKRSSRSTGASRRFPTRLMWRSSRFRPSSCRTS